MAYDWIISFCLQTFEAQYSFNCLKKHMYENYKISFMHSKKEINTEVWHICPAVDESSTQHTKRNLRGTSIINTAKGTSDA